MTNYSFEELTEIARALADPSRLRALLALRLGELCVCQIVALLGLAPSTVSRHMAVLKQARLVESRKKGRWVYYRLAERRTRQTGQALEWVQLSLSDQPEAVQDGIKVQEISTMDPEVLSRNQREGL